MKKYVKVEWPEIQDYMNNPDTWEPDDLGLGGDIGDLEDAMG